MVDGRGRRVAHVEADSPVDVVASGTAAQFVVTAGAEDHVAAVAAVH